MKIDSSDYPSQLCTLGRRMVQILLAVQIPESLVKFPMIKRCKGTSPMFCFEIMASINMYYKKIYKRYEHHYDIRCKIINIMANIYQYLITIKICKNTSRYTSAPGPYGRLAAERRAFGGRLAPQQAQPAAARAGAGAPAPGALEAPRPRGGAEETRLLRVTRATEKTRRAGGAGSIAKLPWW